MELLTVMLLLVFILVVAFFSIHGTMAILLNNSEAYSYVWSLRKDYLMANKFDGERWFLNFSKIGEHFFIGCMFIGACRNGLYMSGAFPFNYSFSPIIVPWEDVSVNEVKGWFFNYVILNFERHRNIDVKIQKISWDKILACIYTPRDLSNIKVQC